MTKILIGSGIQDFELKLSFAHLFGVNGLEVNLEDEPYELFLSRYRIIISRYSHMLINGHLPCSSSLGKGIGSENEEKRRDEVEKLKQYIQDAFTLGINFLIMHLGEYTKGMDLEKYLLQNQTSVTQILEYAASLGITIGVENPTWKNNPYFWSIYNFLEFVKSMKESGWRNLKLVLDTGHYLSGVVSPDNKIDRTCKILFDAANEYDVPIEELHLTNSDIDTENKILLHRRLTEGILDFNGFRNHFQKAKIPLVVLEAFTKDPEIIKRDIELAKSLIS